MVCYCALVCARVGMHTAADGEERGWESRLRGWLSTEHSGISDSVFSAGT